MSSQIIETQTFEGIVKAAGDLSGALILLDVDDTIITPKAAMFRWNSPHKGLMDDIKNERDKYENFETLISTWRLQRKVLLVDSGWPDHISCLKKGGASVYALTHMDIGRVGLIPSMEEWRYRELAGLGVYFTPSFKCHEEELIIPENKDQSIKPAVFYRGIFMTSGPKGVAVRKILKGLCPSKVVFADDRRNYVEQVCAVCEEMGVSAVGIHYTGAALVTGKPNERIVKLQKKCLLDPKNPVWLEDEMAAEILASKEIEIER